RQQCRYSFFFQAEDGIRDFHVTGVQTCALPICFHQRHIAPHGRHIRERREYRADDGGGLRERNQVRQRGLLSSPRITPGEVRVRSEERRVGKEWGCRGSAEGGVRRERASACR